VSCTPPAAAARGQRERAELLAPRIELRVLARAASLACVQPARAADALDRGGERLVEQVSPGT
jgi:hypothetical protein